MHACMYVRVYVCIYIYICICMCVCGWVYVCVCGCVREREMFYLTTHSTHFIYGYMASDIWLRTILIVRKETRCRHIGYSYRLTARVLLYAPSHRQDNTYHGLCYTSRGALAGTRNVGVYAYIYIYIYIYIYMCVCARARVRGGVVCDTARIRYRIAMYNTTIITEHHTILYPYIAMTENTVQYCIFFCGNQNSRKFHNVLCSYTLRNYRIL